LNFFAELLFFVVKSSWVFIPNVMIATHFLKKTRASWQILCQRHNTSYICCCYRLDCEFIRSIFSFQLRNQQENTCLIYQIKILFLQNSFLFAALLQIVKSYEPFRSMMHWFFA